MAAGTSEAVAAPKECRGTERRSTDCASTNQNQNQPPTISGTPSTQSIVGQAYTFTPAASDPEGRSLSFSISNKPPWATFSTSTGRLSGVPSASDEGEHADINIQVSDGKLTAALAPFFIVVNAGNRAPSITGTPPAAARAGQTYDFRPTAADADGDSLSFTISNRPSWATFDPQTGRLSGTPAAGNVGTYRDIVIRVSDGSLVSSLPAFSIDVEQTSLGSATLSWVAPTLRDDGSALTNLAGYRIRYGTSAGSYPNQVQIPNPGVTTCVIENLPPGTYYFVATAYDANGNESGYSAVVTKTIG
jgi:hypothetical protein